MLGNGDIWEAEDALRMMRSTGCDGVIVGRGCLGRPWLFRDLASVFDGREPENPPLLGGIVDIMLEHATLLSEWFGERIAMRSFRRHSTWYTKGFRGSAELRQRLMQIATLRDLQCAWQPSTEAAVPAIGHARAARQGIRHSGRQFARKLLCWIVMMRRPRARTRRTNFRGVEAEARMAPSRRRARNGIETARQLRAGDAAASRV